MKTSTGRSKRSPDVNVCLYRSGSGSPFERPALTGHVPPKRKSSAPSPSLVATSSLPQTLIRCSPKLRLAGVSSDFHRLQRAHVFGGRATRQQGSRRCDTYKFGEGWRAHNHKRRSLSRDFAQVRCHPSPRRYRRHLSDPRRHRGRCTDIRHVRDTRGQDATRIHQWPLRPRRSARGRYAERWCQPYPELRQDFRRLSRNRTTGLMARQPPFPQRETKLLHT